SSGKTNEANGTTSACSAPTPDPSWLRVSAVSPTQINLQWDDNSPNEDGFKVERKQGCCGPWIEIATCRRIRPPIRAVD
ncbi:MAG TPA: fibronectin type III domain-containing protein, partial [Thermoanaerobaculia bacterium]|nr:fibronectin type III domain-containing protein [Thermoanaerobaculia bacterium]